MKFARRFSLPFLTLTRTNTDETMVNQEILEDTIPEEEYQTDTLTAEEFAKMVGIEIKEEFEELHSIHTTSSYSFPKLDLSLFTPPTEQTNPFDLQSLSQSLPDTEMSTAIHRRRFSDCRIEKKGRFTVEKQVVMTRKSSRFEFVKDSRPRLSSVDSGIEINSDL